MIEDGLVDDAEPALADLPGGGEEVGGGLYLVPGVASESAVAREQAIRVRLFLGGLCNGAGFWFTLTPFRGLFYQQSSRFPRLPEG